VTALHPTAALVHRLYEARAREDLGAVRAVLAEDIVWREPGQAWYSGEHRGRDAVLALLTELSRRTDRSFRLAVRDVIANDTHAVALVHWSVERGRRRIEGRDAGVFSVRDGRIAEVWFVTENQPEIEEFFE
jgi:ketosteroid isomerase-like protein